MLRVLDNLDRVAALRDDALEQDDHLVADLVRGGQVVRDVEERDAVFVAQAQHDIEDHRAQRRVDRGHRLVGHDQPRAQHVSRATMTHALALSAGKLVRMLLQDLVPAHAHQLEGVLDQRARFLL